jgi:hypothetical protein
MLRKEAIEIDKKMWKWNSNASTSRDTK